MSASPRLSGRQLRCEALDAPANDVDVASGDCAPFLHARFANPCHASGSSAGPRFWIASRMASRACVNVEFEGVSVNH